MIHLPSGGRHYVVTDRDLSLEVSCDTEHVRVDVVSPRVLVVTGVSAGRCAVRVIGTAAKGTKHTFGLTFDVAARP